MKISQNIILIILLLIFFQVLQSTTVNYYIPTGSQSYPLNNMFLGNNQNVSSWTPYQEVDIGGYPDLWTIDPSGYAVDAEIEERQIMALNKRVGCPVS